MNRIILVSVFVGCCLALPQRQSGAPKENPYVKILELESYQNGADYGHSLQQEDGTATGQKVGPDGLVYGFYSYLQEDGTRVKVYYRAGQGVGYEVLKVEGLDEKGLGNLRPTISQTPPQDIAPRQRTQERQPTQIVRQTVVQPQPQHQPRNQPRIEQQPVQRPLPVVHQPQPDFRQPQPVFHQPQPVIPQVNPLVPEEPTPAPHRFDYPANLNLQRTGTGFRSSFKAL